jgi:GNAT superfamily N-acetyltransferase
MVQPSHAAIAAYLRRSITEGRDSARIGPFLASWSRSSRNPFLNYAIPDDGATPSPDDIAGLVDVYDARGLAPRLEYLPDLAPAVEPALLHAGFAAEARLVLMAPDGSTDTAAPDGIELVTPASDDELNGIRLVQHEAYDDIETIDDAAIARLRANLAGGAGAVLARTTGDREPVGAGEFTAPIDGVAEITSVGVRAAWRRQGIAAAITTRLLADARAAGVTTPFLMAMDDESRVYARVGFTPIGSVLHISHGRQATGGVGSGDVVD